MSEADDKTTATAEAASPDAELIAACDRFIRAEAEYRRQVYADPENGNVDQDFTDNEYDPAMEAVRDLPAATIEGFKAKASAIHAWYDPDPPRESVMCDATWNLICDMAGKPESRI